MSTENSYHLTNDPKVNAASALTACLHMYFQRQCDNGAYHLPSNAAEQAVLALETAFTTAADAGISAKEIKGLVNQSLVSFKQKNDGVNCNKLNVPTMDDIPAIT